MKKSLVATVAVALVLAVAVAVALVGSMIARQGSVKTTDGNSRTYRIGIVGGFKFFQTSEDGFKARMANLGYVEGKNVTYEIQEVSGVDTDAIANVIKKFVNDKVDLIYSYPTEVAVIAKKVTKGTNIPVVFSEAVIEGADLVDSVRIPGANITGVRYIGPDFVLKRFEVMRQIVPQAKRLLVAYQDGYPSSPPQLEYLRSATKAVGMSLVALPVKDAKDLEEKLKAMVKKNDPGVDVILTIMDPIGITPETFVVLAKFAREYRLPIGGAYMNVDGYRSLFGVSGDIYHSGEQVADIVDKVFRGTPAGTISVVSIESYFQIDYKAVTEAGLTVSESLLSQANKVILE